MGAECTQHLILEGRQVLTATVVLLRGIRECCRAQLAQVGHSDVQSELGHQKASLPLQATLRDLYYSLSQQSQVFNHPR